MNHKNTQKVLLTKAALTLDKAIEISQGMEAAAQKSKELSGVRRSSPCVVQIVHAPGSGAKMCGRCGRGNHDSGECKFRNATCGKVGHIAPVCRSSSGKTRRGPTKWLDATDTTTTDTTTTEGDHSPNKHTSNDSATHPLFVVHNKDSPPPYQLTSCMCTLTYKLYLCQTASVKNLQI